MVGVSVLHRSKIRQFASESAMPAMVARACSSELMSPTSGILSEVNDRFVLMTQPGDEWAADDATIIGALARVVRVAENSEVIYAMFQNGNVTRLVASGPTAIEPEDIVLVGDGRWLVVEDDLWHEPRGIGIVRKQFNDRLLIEAPGGLLVTERVGEVPPTVGNTVLFSSREGTVEILAEAPMRAHDRDDDVDDISRFDFTAAKGELKYTDFGGYSGVVERARHILETQFNHKDRLDEIKARPVRGVLLSGPPGTGKTYLARVIAAESDAAFFLVSGPAIVSKFVGDTEQLLRRIFQEAQKRERAIVFFDEIDSIAGERNEGSHEASDRLVAQLLTEMDGFSQAEGNVIVLAATNRPNSIDPALRRPGRFDWEIGFDLPNMDDRLAILEVDARRLATVEPLPFESIAQESAGWSGAELASLWTEAALLAARDDRPGIDGEDLLEAFSVVATTRQGKRHDV